MMRRSIPVVACLLAALTASAACAGFLKDLDTLMRNYADNIIKQGDDVRNAFANGFDMKALDTAMKAYSDDIIKTGDDAWRDLKAVLKDLLDIRTYLPGPLRAAWEAFVKEIAVLRQRFLWRTEHPWEDDPPAGGGDNPPSNIVVGPTPGDGSPPADTQPADPAPVTGPSPSPVSDPAPLSGKLPGDASASVTRGAKVLSQKGMVLELDTFVNYRKTTEKAHGWLSGLDAQKKQAIGPKVDWMVREAHRMDEVLVAKAASNATFLKVLVAYVKRLDASTARGSFGNVLSNLARKLNADAMADRGSAVKRSRAIEIAALKKQVMGR